MAASFLPYCAHCDKQIVIPNSSVLYCSESCRKKDKQTQSLLVSAGSAPQPSTQDGTSITPPGSPREVYGDFPPPPNLIPPSSPTPPHAVPIRREFVDPSDPISIVAQNLRQFVLNDQTVQSAPSSPTNSSNIYQPQRRPLHAQRASTGGSVPSLAGSESTASSSSQYESSPHYPQQGQYFNMHRPLPPLHHPYSYSSSPRSIDLVTPYTAATSPIHRGTSPERGRSDDASHLFYEKKWTLPLPGTSNQSGTLKKLFNFDGMRATAPSSARATPYGSRAGTPAGSRSSSPVPMYRINQLN